jgi:hypothetical protein
MSNNNNCQQCAPVPTVPLAPPPTCPATAACEDYVLSDCVLSTVDSNCQLTYTQPSGNTTTVGVDINVNTTLTTVYQQLTTTACPTNPDVIGGTLFQIENVPMLFEMFSNLVCMVDCGVPCDAITSVEQVTFTNITDTGFSINWFGLKDYNYSIRMNDSNSSPATFYTWQTQNPLSGNASFAVNTSAFSENVGGVVTTPPPAMELPSNHSFEVYITAEFGGVSCETGPFTILTLPSSSCICNNTLTVTPAKQSGTVDPLELAIGILTIGDVPLGYNVLVQDSTGACVLNCPNGVFVPYAPDPVTNLTYFTANMPSGGDYSVTVTAICTLAPLCDGDVQQVIIPVPDTLSCAAPDITSIVVNP